MSEELVYTSAQEGLKRGSHGFCTVISTPGVSKSLADRLESLSGYRHHFPPHDPQSNLNPINFFHYVVSVGGDRFNVLSRICNAGLDYTQRSNKLAHHVALRRDELVACGPAAVQSTPGFHDETFDGSPRHLGSGRTPADAASTLKVCDAWKHAAGDAGWAGHLAESFLASRDQYVSVIYPVGADVLPLISEALSLVPRERRWEVTYSTYVTRLPAGVDCHWRFYLDGSKEANALKRNPHAQVIDLTATPGQASGGDLVEAARTGRLAQPAPKPEPKLEPTPEPKPDRSVTDEQTRPKAGAEAADAETSDAETSDAETSDRIALAIRVPPVPDDASDRSGDMPPVLPGAKATGATPPSLPGQTGEGDGVSKPDFSSKSATPYKIYSAVITAVLLLVIVGVVINAIQPEVEGVAVPGESGEVVVATSEEVDEAEQRRGAEGQKKQDQAELDRKRKELVEGTRKPPLAKTQDKGKQSSKGKDVVKKPPPRNRDKRDPLKDIKARDNILALPETNKTDILTAKASRVLLATLYTNQLHECSLKLVSGLIAKPSVIYKLVEKSPKDERRRIWNAIRVPKNNTGVGGEEPLETQIGTFEIKSVTSSGEPGQSEQRLYFEWHKQVPVAVPDDVRLMDLEVIVGKQKAVCGLDQPEVLEAIAVKFGKKRELGPNLDTVSRLIRQHAADVFLDLELFGFEPNAIVTRWRFPPDAREASHPVKGSRDFLREIPMGKVRIKIVVSRLEKKAITVVIDFVAPPAGRNARLDATWKCQAYSKTGFSFGQQDGFTLEDAREGLKKTGARIREVTEFITDRQKEKMKLEKNLPGLRAKAKRLKNTQVGMMAFAAVKITEARLNRIPIAIANQELVIKNLKSRDPYHLELIKALEKHDGKCGIAWRIYLRRDGREKTLAISKRWISEKRPAR
jgi:hypothetical protein